MATQKEYSLLFKLQASLGSDFSKTMTSATAATKTLQSAMSSLKSTSSKIESFEKQTTALDNQKSTLTKLQTEYQKLQQEIEETANGNGTLQKKMNSLDAQIEKTTGSITIQENTLDNQKIKLSQLQTEYQGLQRKMEETGDENGELCKEMEKVESQIVKTTATIKTQENRLDSKKIKLSQLQTEYLQLQKEIKETGDETGELQAKMEKVESQIVKTTATIKTQETKLDSLGNELREAGVDTDNLVSENARLEESYNKLRESQEKLANISQAQQKNNEAIAKTQSQLTTAVTATAAAGATVAATMIAPTMAFNNEMAMVGTMLNGTTAEITAKTGQLGKEAVALSSAMGIDTTEVTDGLYNVISAYGETDEAMKQLEVTAQAAKAGGATVSEALGLISATTKGYGDTSAEAQQKAADLAFQTVKLGQTTFPELASAMGSVIPTAAAMKVSQEEIYGAMATLTGVTGGASEVTTQLNGVLQGFLSPSKDMEDQLQALGYASGAAMMESLGLQGSLETLKTAVDGDTLALGNLFGSSEAQTAIFAMVGEQSENLTEKTLAMSSATGAATEAFDLMNSTDMAKWEQATQTFKNLGIVLGQSLMPAITPIIEKVNELITQFSEWASNNPELVASIFKITAGLAALVIGGLAVQLAVQKIYSGFLMVKKGIEIAKLGVNVFSSAFKLLTPNIAVITAIAGAIWYVCTHLEEVRAFIENAFGTDALAVFDGFVDKVQAIGTVIKTVLSGDMETAKQIIGDTFGEGGLIILESFHTAFESIKAVLPPLIQNIQGMLEAIIPMFMEIGAALIPIISEVINTLVPIIGGLGVAFITIAGEVLPYLIEAVSFAAFAFTELIEWVGKVANTFSQWASENPEVVSTVTQIIVTVASMALGLKKMFTVASGVVKSVSSIFNTLSPVFNVAKTALGLLSKGFSSLFTLITTNHIIAVIALIIGAVVLVCTHLEEVRAFIEKTFGSEALAYFDGFVALVQWVGEVISDSFHNVMLMFADIGEKISAGLTTGMEALQSFGEGVANFVSSTIEFFNSLGEYLTIAFVATWETGWLMITSSWEVIKTVFSGGVEAVIGFLTGILDFICNVFSTAWSTAWQGIQNLFSSIMDVIGIYVQTGIEVFNGLIDFITGVFTGNWQQAWDGVKSIFSGAFDGIKSICSTVMNTIISGINVVIKGLNGLEIPDWVPGMGGMSLSIPLIPQFAKGTNYTPDTFIAGEAGAELITGAAGRKVFTAAQTGEIFHNIYKAQEMAETLPNYGDNATTVVAVAPELLSAMSAVQQSKSQALGDLDEIPPPPPPLPHPKGGTGEGGDTAIHIVINSNPTFNISGGGEVDEDKLRAMFEQYKALIKAEIYEEFESALEDRVRRAYD